MVDLIFKLFGFFLGGIIAKRKEQIELWRKLEGYKNRIRYVGMLNNYPVELNRLRDFIVSEGLVQREGVSDFFVKWLHNPLVIMGEPVVNPFSHEEIKDLMRDLETLRL